jgi:hypothetical protein
LGRLISGEPVHHCHGKQIAEVLAILAGIPAAYSQQPTCAKPAELLGHFSAEAPNAIVMVRKGRNLNDMVRHLATKHHFVPYAFKSLHGFAAQKATEELVSKLRCEAGIDYIEWDAPVHVS